MAVLAGESRKALRWYCVVKNGVVSVSSCIKNFVYRTRDTPWTRASRRAPRATHNPLRMPRTWHKCPHVSCVNLKRGLV